METEFKRCGQGENTCNCKTETECGYSLIEDSEYATCEHCGGDAMWEDCWQCGGEGGTDGEELMMEDPMWYSEEDFRECDICDGKGGFHLCVSKCDGKNNLLNQAVVSGSVASIDKSTKDNKSDNDSACMTFFT